MAISKDWLRYEGFSQITNQQERTNTQRINDIEPRRGRLVKHRQGHNNPVLAEVAKMGQVAVIEEFNQRIEQEKNCEVMEAQVRELDPKNSYQEIHPSTT